MWTTVRRWAGMLLAGALGGFALLFAYWAVGGTWGLAEMWGEEVELPPQAAWLLWLTALCLAGWMLMVLAAVHGRGGQRMRGFLRLGCWVMAVALFEVGWGSLQGQAPWERLMFGPLLLVLSLVAVMVALDLRPPRLVRRRMFL